MNWTDAQQAVIDAKKTDILVSAGAGSGKTAVLVARIMNMLTRAEDRVSIDELLIVTFTRAAAAEMKERIDKAISDALEKDPENEDLAEQSDLLPRALITTIDGFCSHVVREYGHTRGIAPGLRTAEDGEVKLLKSDVAKNVIEAGYGGEEEESPGDFEKFAETFSSGKSDTGLDKLIINIYDKAMSSPDPDAWLDMCASACDGASSLDDMPWMKKYVEDIISTLEVLKGRAEENLEITKAPGGPQAYAEAAAADLEFLNSLSGLDSYASLREAVGTYKALKLTGASSDTDKKLKDRFSKGRDEIKKAILHLREEALAFDPDMAFRVLLESMGPVRTLVSLVRRFREAYDEEKRKRGIVDFSDLEHMACDILRDGEEPSEAAKEIAGKLKEVMVDEYQDSNYLQEAILTSVTGEYRGVHDYFQVGDVKQSIYSFRQARPDLFMEKYRLFSSAPERGRKIDLHSNFRSRREVIDTVNAIFRQIMRREVGGVEYDDDAALEYGASYPEEAPGYEAEIMPVLTGVTDDDGVSLLEDTGSLGKRRAEARAVGEKMRTLKSELKFFDPKTEEERPLEWRDMVILMRSPRGTAEIFADVIGGMGIPVYYESSTGYFGAWEVREILSYLEILDDPLQDIPFAAVLRSPFGGLDARELALVRIHGREMQRSGAAGDPADGAAAEEAIKSCAYLANAARSYAEGGDDAALRAKLEDFFRVYDGIRDEVPHTPIHEILYRVTESTGFSAYCAALPGGEQRSLNISMLSDEAAEYEKTSYRGIFHFVRYIRKMEKQEIDPGELSSINEKANVVRIYSIHKSKGLEFPVVFVSCCDKMFNKMDLRAQVLVHPDYGIGSSYVDLKKRVRMPCVLREAIKTRLERDLAGEELRVLYVAMTRAKQKLIMTGAVKDEAAVEDMMTLMGEDDGAFSPAFITRAKSFMDWLIPSAGRVIDAFTRTGEKPFLKLEMVSPSALVNEAAAGEALREDRLDAFRGVREGDSYAPDFLEKLERAFSYVYPGSGKPDIPRELSVSAMKEMAAFRDADEGEAVHELYSEEVITPTVPAFALGEGAGEAEEAAGITGAERGTAYHRLMEVLDYASIGGTDGDAVRDEMEKHVREGRMTARQGQAIIPDKISAFLESDLGRRVSAAAKAGKLVREQPFVMNMRADMIEPSWPSDEYVMVQGMADAYFEEDGGIVLIDYKTDRVGSGRELAERYRVQLEAYSEALRRGTGLPVKEIYLWSFHLGEAVGM